MIGKINTSFSYFLDSPILGWGAQVDLPGLEHLPALGSHSYYLNILFSTGIVGFSLLFSFIFIFLLYFKRRQYNFIIKKYVFGSWLIFFFVSITEAIHLDMLTIFALVILTAISSIRGSGFVLTNKNSLKFR